MQDNVLASLSRLSDSELVASLKGLTARERAATAELVAHIAELETRDIHLRAGYASLFVYCRDVLALSEAEAYNRIEAARAARRFPVILRLLSEGAIHLTTVRLLAPHLTPGNHLQVLETARGKRKAEVEAIVAELAPRPDVPASIRKLPRANASASATPPASEAAPSTKVVIPVVPAPAAGPAARESGTRGPVGEVRPAPPAIAPLAPERYRFQVTIGVETLEKLRLAKDMLRHAVPSGDEAAILDRALTALLAELARRKHAATDSQRPSSDTRTESRHIPAQVRRTVWLRDDGRCVFEGDRGRRCGEQAFLEFHHIKPYAVGGGATVENVQLRCRRHNDYEARVYFGRGETEPCRGPSGRTTRFPRAEAVPTRSGTSPSPSAAGTGDSGAGPRISAAPGPSG